MTLLLMTCLQELFFRLVTSDAFFRHILPDASKLQIKFLCSWTCSIRIFMNSNLIMDPVYLNKLFSKSNWWFLIPCYYQNSIGDFVKHPLFQHSLRSHNYVPPLELQTHYISTTNVRVPSDVGLPLFSIHTTLALPNVRICI